jgi:hypothetical protein
MTSACNCCDDPPCPTPELEFLSLSGYVACPTFLNPADGQYYDTLETTNIEGVTEKTTWGKNLAGECEATTICSGGWTETTDFDNWRCSTAGGGVPVSIHRTGEFVVQYGFFDALNPCDLGCQASGTKTLAVSTYDVEEIESFTCTETADPECAFDYNDISCPEGSFGWGSESACGEEFPADDDTTTRVPPLAAAEVSSYSNEAPLVFPEWHTWDTPPEEWLDGQGDLDFAQKSDDLIRVRVKWRVKNLPSGTCYLRVWIQKTFTPAPDPDAPFGTPDPPPVITILDPIEWIGEGTPCFEFPLLSASDAANTIHTAEVLNPDPSTNGIDTFAILKWACVPDYVPEIDNPAKPNGYPNLIV